jgi:ribokinase
VIVVGSINVDLVVRTAHLPAPGETVTGGTFARHFGGKGANQAVAAARLGATVKLVGAVGDDAFGADSLADLVAEGIDVSFVSVLPGTPTGVALIAVGERGENQIVVASGANSGLTGAAVRAALQGMTDEAVLLTNLEVPDAVVVAAVQAARERGWTVIVNPAPARELPVELVACHPILVPNEGEAQVLSGAADAAAAARRLAAQTAAPVIVTLGADGALLQPPDGKAMRIAAPHVEVTDTTGAGDAFTGALAAELARGSTLADAARFAAVAAALSVTGAGARGGMPARAAVSERMGGDQLVNAYPPVSADHKM